MDPALRAAPGTVRAQPTWEVKACHCPLIPLAGLTSSVVGFLGSVCSSSSSSSSSARPGPPQPEEAIDFREEGPECETPAIFISMDDDSGLTEAALLDSSLEGPLPKVGMTTPEQQRTRETRGRG